MPRPATSIGQLTDREQDVARLLARGKTNPEIAEELGVTFATAKWYVSQVIAKLDASSREQAAETWRREHAFRARWRRGIATLAGGMAARRALVGLAAVAGVVGAALFFALLDRDSDAPAAVDETPTTSATPTAAVTDPCDPANLVNGFVVIGEGEPVPGCANEGRQPIPTDQRTYAFDVPPGAYSAAYIEPDIVELPDGRRFGGYIVSLRGTPAFALYWHYWYGLFGRTIEGSDPRPVDFLPGPGIRAERSGSVAAYWLEGSPGFTYGIELFQEGADARLTLRDIAARLYYVGQSTPTPTYWDPDTHEFVQTWLPPWLYGDDVAHLDAIAQGYPGADTLEPFADTVHIPCGESLPCDDGSATGTPQEAVLVGTCSDFTPRPASERTIFSGPIQPTVGLFGVARDTNPQFAGVEYRIFFQAGHQAVQILVGDEGIVGLTPLCPLSDLVRWAVETETWLRAPVQNIDP